MEIDRREFVGAFAALVALLPFRAVAAPPISPELIPAPALEPTYPLGPGPRLEFAEGFRDGSFGEWRQLGVLVNATMTRDFAEFGNVRGGALDLAPLEPPWFTLDFRAPWGEGSITSRPEFRTASNAHEPRAELSVTDETVSLEMLTDGGRVRVTDLRPTDRGTRSLPGVQYPRNALGSP
jgi:hypothetical protein